jgi:hypothetical protein
VRNRPDDYVPTDQELRAIASLTAGWTSEDEGDADGDDGGDAA